jgi:hypothetical protein
MRNLAALNPQTKLLLGAVATLGLFVFLLSGSGGGGMPPPKSRYERTLDYDRPLSPSPPRARSSPSSSQHDAEKTTGGESEPDDGDWSAEEVAELRASMDQLNEETKRLAKEDKALRQELAQVRAAMLQLTTAKVKLPAVCEELWMTDVDRRAFVGALTDRMVRQYIEWGGGGSTLCASALVANGTRALRFERRLFVSRLTYAHVCHVASSHDDRAQRRVVREAEAADQEGWDHQRQHHLYARRVEVLWYPHPRHHRA